VSTPAGLLEGYSPGEYATIREDYVDAYGDFPNWWVGWAAGLGDSSSDWLSSDTDGLSLDITKVRIAHSGWYWLELSIDPNGEVYEQTEANNSIRVLVNLKMLLAEMASRSTK
jgi:hypothetical protein